MRVGSLFSGIGGLDLGLQRAGFEIAWQVEIDVFCRDGVLTKHWPEVPKFADIRTCGKHNLEPVDLIAGGFPCQDISSAGKQTGIEGERSGLWREQARIIEELHPRYVLIENVAALLYAIKGPDGHKRPAAIQRVLRDLAAGGYDAEWRLCSAAEFGAPHLRKRVFIVAYLPHCGYSPLLHNGRSEPAHNDTAIVGHAAGQRQQERHGTTRLHAESGAPGQPGQPLADADGDGRGQRAGKYEPGTRRAAAANAGEESAGTVLADAARGEGRWLQQRELYPDAGPGSETLADAGSAGCQKRDRCAGAQSDQRGDARTGDEGATVPGMGRDAYGFSDWLDQVEYRWPAGPGTEQFAWEPPRIVTERVPDRPKRLKGLGNAALPQIAEVIGRCILQHAARWESAERVGDENEC